MSITIINRKPQGPEGPIGPEGPRGLNGKSFEFDHLGLYSDLYLFDEELKDFAYLATDTGEAYFKLSDNPGDWSEAVPFRGEAGQEGPIGPKGEDGIDGQQGLQGETGPIGPEGPKGLDGKNFEFNQLGLYTDLYLFDDELKDFSYLATDTGEAYFKLSNDSGDWSDPVAFRGEEGPQGPEGIQGPQGPEGPIGPEGIQGLQGEIGPIGPEGPQGVQGPIGPIGPQGEIGPQGPIGPEGVEGPIGPQGEIGPEGPEGQIPDLSDIVSAPTSIDLINGSYLSGNIDDLSELFSQDSYKIQEDASTPGILLEFNYTGVEEFNTVRGHLKYYGSGPTHNIYVEIYNYVTLSWVRLAGFQISNEFRYYSLPIVDDNYILDGAAKMRLFHPAPGNTNHYLDIDYICLIQSYIGSKGDKGDKGDAGPQGIQGEAGPIGPEGLKGEDGTSVKILGSLDSELDLPVEGEIGDSYLIDGDLYVWVGLGWENAGSIQGPEGPQGTQGPQGEDGPQGLQGIQGEIGPQGIQGEDGLQGLQGVQGEIGPAGPAGPQGEVGPQGPEGSITNPLTESLTAFSNDSYSTKQIRNIILSSEEPDPLLLANGDIWMQWEV